MNKYKEMTEQVMSKVQEIFDGAALSSRVEIHIEMERGSIPLICYRIEDLQVVPSEGDGV